MTRTCLIVLITSSTVGLISLLSRYFDFSLTKDIIKVRRRVYELDNDIRYEDKAESNKEKLIKKKESQICWSIFLGRLTKFLFFIQLALFLFALWTLALYSQINATMAKDIILKALTDVLQIYFNYDDAVIDELLLEPNLVKKERVAKIDDLEIIIYTNDHNPPHFHVKTKEKNIDAKFSIETGEYLSGEIDSKNLKRIKAFYLSPKTKVLLDIIWNKRFQ